MIHVPVASIGAFWKSYSTASFENIEAFKAAVSAKERRVVHLITVDPWDNSWEYVQSGLPLENLGETHLAWLAARTERFSRYLECGL